ncbi:FG-GAP-like repeat-containing protein [Streptomyces sp. NPDC002574]|uniref:FG-GAP-like repeat-containing protein n=1 Tax=Streptomyces sp. NPDC002574 TaxID=3364652 RepID=UPI003698E350
MGRHALRRGRLAIAVSATALGLLAGLVPLVTGSSAGQAQAAEATSEVVLDSPRTDTPRRDRILGAGTTGFLHRLGDVPGLQWTSYKDGSTVTVEGPSGAYRLAVPCWDINEPCPGGWYGGGGDTVALPDRSYTEPVSLWDPATKGLRTVTLPEGDYVATYGNTVIAQSGGGSGRGRLELTDFSGDGQRTRNVPGSPAVSVGAVAAGDAAGALVRYTASDESGAQIDEVGYLDFAKAEFTEVFQTDAQPQLVLTADRVGWYTSSSGLHTKPRGDLTAQETVLVVRGTAVEGRAVLVGDWLLLGGDMGSPSTQVSAISLRDGVARTLPGANGNLIAAPDGSGLLAGGTSASDWWIQRVSQGEDGSLETTRIYKVPPYENPKLGLALSRGRLRVAESGGGGNPVQSGSWALSTAGGTLTASARMAAQDISTAACPYSASSVTCTGIWGDSGVMGDVFLGYGNVLRTLNDNPDSGSSSALDFHAGAGRIVDVSDHWAVFDSTGTSPAQYVGDFEQRHKLQRTVRAAALNGSTLWSPGTVAGQLTSYDIETSKTLSTVSVGAPCVPKELQATGNWVYWSCGDAGPAGVWDIKAKKSVRVAPGDVLLGDGYTVRHDHAAGTLVLTNAATGATRVLTGEVADSGLAVDRRYRFAVDEYTGLVAWVDPRQQVHVATTGIAPSTLGLFTTQVDSEIYPREASRANWHGDWLLSRPVTSWTLTFATPQGKVLRTLSGKDVPAQLSVSWNGRTDSGTYFPNGRFAWTLKATAAGTSSAVTAASGSGGLYGGAAVLRDYGSGGMALRTDGVGDLLTLDSAGRLAYRWGQPFTGAFAGSLTGSGWATNVKVVPVGDLSGDRCNDLLVRLGNGSVRLYKPACSKAATPTTAYNTVGTGWNQYDVLTSPGDITGDGLSDVLARRASDGAVYLYKGVPGGKLSAPVKLYANWKAYKKIVGAGDLTGDGFGDVLVHDTGNELWRFDGDGKGHFKARVKVADNWGTMFNALVGVGDITGDGKADLVVRDSAGALWRYSGNGKGTVGARVKIGTGYQGYKGLY